MNSPTTSSIADTILLTIEEGVTIYDTDFRLVAWNDQYAEMGITPPDKIRDGLHIEDTYRYAADLGVFGKGDPNRIANERIHQLYAGDSPKVEDLLGCNGRTIEIRRFFLPGIGVAAVFTDVTDARRTAAKLRRAEDLEVLAKSTGGFAHDFNNILQAIMTNLHLAKKNDDLKHVENAARATESGAELARSMLALASPNYESEGAQYFEITDAVEKTIRWIGRVLPDNIEIVTSFNTNGMIVDGNESWFSMCLVNLVMNSRDAIQNDGVIQISVNSDSPNRLNVTIEDNGCGMDDHVVCRLNEPFFTTKGAAGTGLGIYEVKRFAKSLGGCFEISSAVGSGTIASICLPARPANSVVERQSVNTKKLSRSLRLLVVEDNFSVQESNLSFFSSIGCRVTAVATGEEAVSLLSELDQPFFDVLVSDVSLGGATNGIELARFVLKRFPRMPIVLCSADIDISDRIPEATTFIRKPWDVSEMQNHLSKIADSMTI